MFRLGSEAVVSVLGGAVDFYLGSQRIAKYEFLFFLVMWSLLSSRVLV